MGALVTETIVTWVTPIGTAKLLHGSIDGLRAQDRPQLFNDREK